MMRKIEREPNGTGRFAPGQDLVIAGVIAKEGAKAALKQKREVLESRFCGAFLRKLEESLEEKLNLNPEVLLSLGATEWEEVKEGGILAALWNLSGAYEQGISFSLLKIPVRQEIIEVCELFDLNAYRLRSGECMLIAADHGGNLVYGLEAMGIRAAVIGRVEPGISRKMTGAGGTGVLERPQPDEILKITEEDYHA